MTEPSLYAQTNIQLFNQAMREGYTTGDLALFARAYRFSLPLFSGRFRTSGKTFFAHLVGTASVLASIRARAEVVAAGLLHAAYTHGDFGDGSRGRSEATRSAVRAAVGDRVEDYVARYTAFDWSAQSIPGIAATLERLDDEDRLIVTMRLANELDEYLDLGRLYEGGDRQRVHDHAIRTNAVFVEIAERLGQPRLAREFTRILAEMRESEVPVGIADTTVPDESFVVPSTSCQRLMDAVADRLRQPGRPR